MRTNKTVGAIVPHLKTKNGGLRRFVEIGKEFASKGIKFTLYSGKGLNHSEWELPFPVKDWSDIEEDVLLTGDPLDRPDFTKVKGNLFVWVIAGGSYFKYYDKLVQYKMLANNPKFLDRYPNAILLRGGVSSSWKPKELTVGYHGNKGKTVEKELSGLPNIKLVPLKGKNDKELMSAYHSLDWFASAEERLGWCNMAAEAIACGIPVVTMDYNSDGFSNLVVKTNSLRDFFMNPMKGYYWSDVCNQLIKICEI